jgi:hypothetical protein
MGSDMSVMNDENIKTVERDLNGQDDMETVCYGLFRDKLVSLRTKRHTELTMMSINTAHDLHDMEMVDVDDMFDDDDGNEDKGRDATSKITAACSTGLDVLSLGPRKGQVAQLWQNPDAASSDTTLVFVYLGTDATEIVPLCRAFNARLVTFPCFGPLVGCVQSSLTAVVTELLRRDPQTKIVLYGRMLETGSVIHFLHEASRAHQRAVAACVLDTPYYSLKRVIMEVLDKGTASHPMLHTLSKLMGRLVWRKMATDLCAELDVVRKPGKLVADLTTPVHMINADVGFVNITRHGGELKKLWKRATVTTSLVPSHLGRRDRILMLEVAEALRPALQRGAPTPLPPIRGRPMLSSVFGGRGDGHRPFAVRGNIVNIGGLPRSSSAPLLTAAGAS